MDQDTAKTRVYGMPYDEWKAKYQTEATPEQLAKLKKQSFPLTPSTLSRRKKDCPMAPAEMLKTGPAAPELLRQYVERIERLEEEKQALMADIREVYSEAKGHGLNPKIMRQSSNCALWISRI